MDLSKAFDTINHDLLLAKLNVYGVDKKSLLLIKNYLSNRWHRTRINMSFSSWEELLSRVPRGSVLGPLLFNIYFNDLFFVLKETDVGNYADDTNLHAYDMYISNLIQRLEHDALIAIEWFESNYMKMNKEKCHFLVTGHKYEQLYVYMGKHKIWESTSEKILGVQIDAKLKFDKHVDYLLKVGGRKLTIIARMSIILSLSKLRLLIKSFFDSQFSYCPLVWMFCGRTRNNRINKLQERALRILYKDDQSTFQHLLNKDKSITIHARNIQLLNKDKSITIHARNIQLLNKDKSITIHARNIQLLNKDKSITIHARNIQLLNKDKPITIHARNIQLLATEMYKAKNGNLPCSLSEFVTPREISYKLRGGPDFLPYNLTTVYNGTETLSYLGPKIWKLVPCDIKESPSLSSFKSKIKYWITNECPCRLCKEF